MKKILLLAVLCIGLSISTTGATAAQKKLPKKSKKEIAADTTTRKKPPISKYDKLFKGKSHVKAQSDFITLHLVGGKLYFEMPLKLMGRDMLLATTTSQTSDNTIAINGYKSRTPLHICFTREDSMIMMRQVNTSIAYDDSDSRIEKIVATNYINPVLEKFSILAFSPDSLRVVIDMTTLFTGGDEKISPISEGSFPLAIRATINKSMSRIETIKAFSDNLSIRSALNYSVSAKMLNTVLYTDKPAVVVATRSLILLPEIPMQSRRADPRIGIFLTNKRELSDREDQLPRFSLANRWRLVPRDTAAYLRGELCEPEKPIVFYIDSLFPESWITPIRTGILRWNKAFETIGFKNVVQALDFPKDDPEFDPDNIKYSCIRYVPSTTVNAMGPSWTDPRTGEILNASVIVYNNIIKGLNNWRFVQTAQVDPRVRAKKMPDDVRDESMAYVLAHEVGHCLGLMHNMAASAAYPVDSLRSASFTKKYGTTPSIMDYARFNYIAQPSDKGVTLTPPDLGVYDYFAINWLYGFYPKLSAEQQAEKLEAMIDAKAGDPLFRYGKQQIASRYDPSALEEDLGDDPIRAADYGIANLKYIMAHLDQWITDDPDFTHRQELHRQIATQYGRYLNNVLYSIGGIYLNEVKEGTPVKRYAPVPRSKQQASLKWLIGQIRTNEWLDDASLCCRESLGIKYTAELNYSIAQTLTKIYMNVTLSAFIADKNPYSIAEYFSDLYTNIWEPTLKNKPLTQGDKVLQQAMVKMAAQSTSAIGGNKIGLTDSEDSHSYDTAYAPSLREMLLYGLDDSGTMAQYKTQLEAAEKHFGQAWMQAQIANYEHQFGYGYNWQNWVRTGAIDEAPTYYYDMLLKVRRLLTQKSVNGMVADRPHYQAMLFSLNRILEASTAR